MDIDGTVDANPAVYESLMMALRDAGHRVAVLTGASAGKVTKDELAEKCQYLTEMGLGCAWDDLVVFASPPHKAKAKWVKKHGASLLIDNSTKTAPLASKFTTVLVPWATADPKPTVKSAPDVPCQVVKQVAEKRYTLGLAYPANRPDVGTASDGFRDFMTPEALEESAWNYLRAGKSVGLQHTDGTIGHGTVVESYIYRGPDWWLGETVIKSGDWLLGVVWDPPTWAAIKAGRLNGFSPQGYATRRKPTVDQLANLREA